MQEEVDRMSRRYWPWFEGTSAREVGFGIRTMFGCLLKGLAS